MSATIFENKLMADLQRIMADETIPDVPTMKSLVERTEEVINNARQVPVGTGTVIHL
jgi:hypothetical protein